MEELIHTVFPLGFQWQTRDPFLFCVHHEDYYPEGNGSLGPRADLKGRNIGQDFTPKDGWRMYHGEKIPGFPAHPHRGFETVTVVRKGMVDHADSTGASGRYGDGDVQWMTAGKGVQHSEMFPLLNQNSPNTLELFQIWLNLPARKKFSEPYFTMFWNDEIPKPEYLDDHGKKIKLEIIAGSIADIDPISPPPDSWAYEKDHLVAIWILHFEGGANWTIPKTDRGINRILYFYSGKDAIIDGQSIPGYHGIDLKSEFDVPITAGSEGASFLLLQGKPIAEPIVQYGPFVMNSEQEIHKAFQDYSSTRFGGWPWSSSEPTHGAEKKKFADTPKNSIS